MAAAPPGPVGRSLPGLSPALRHDHERLDEGARRQAEVRGHLRDRLAVRRVQLGGGEQVDRGAGGLGERRVGRALGRELARRRLGVGAGDGGLDVGRVAALTAEDDLVLAGVGVGHVLVADRAAHHAGVTLHHHALEAAARVDALVGGDVLAVALLQRLFAHIQAVGVLHDELARAQHAALGPRLVALLGLEVVPHLRQLLVAVDLPRGEPGDDLFVGHGERHVGVLAVLEAEHLAADGVPAAALLPDLRRLQHRHEHLLAADGVHLLADDLLDLLHHAPAGRQVHVDAGGELAHEAGAYHELVAHGLGAGRILFDGGQQQLTQAHGHLDHDGLVQAEDDITRAARDGAGDGRQ